MITPAPPIPNRADPSTFADRADAYVSWWSTVATEINALAAALASYGAVGSTVGGTANAITLTTLLGLSSILTGQVIWLVPSANNTTATTINVDGTGVKDIRTPTLSVLPSGYLEAGVPIQLVYDGTRYIAQRRVQTISSANGQASLFPDGTLICRHSLTTSSSSNVTWTFPKAFVNTTYSVNVQHTGLILTYISGASGQTTTTVNVNLRDASGTRVAASVDLICVGRWYAL